MQQPGPTGYGIQLVSLVCHSPYLLSRMLRMLFSCLLPVAFIATASAQTNPVTPTHSTTHQKTAVHHRAGVRRTTVRKARAKNWSQPRPLCGPAFGDQPPTAAPVAAE